MGRLGSGGGAPPAELGWRRRDAQCWQGLTTLVARESVGRYTVGWRTKLLLVAKDQLRLATLEATKAFEEIASARKLVGIS